MITFQQSSDTFCSILLSGKSVGYIQYEDGRWGIMLLCSRPIVLEQFNKIIKKLEELTAV